VVERERREGEEKLSMRKGRGKKKKKIE